MRTSSWTKLWVYDFTDVWMRLKEMAEAGWMFEMDERRTAFHSIRWRKDIMGTLGDGKEKAENIARKARMKRSEQKKKRPKAGGKKKMQLKLTIPSRRGRKK